jgi:phenylpropionate dioxygenase-like ring-hydroxylating dioxygenase large terminal subunit
MAHDSQAALPVLSLVRGDRVHRRVFEDPAVFELEMERIFGRAFVYVGHESQVPRPGDFATSTIGHNPVILVRHQDGTINVLHNRCGHRGALVCNVAGGNVRRFRCPYHGWTFETNGDLYAVPARAGYDAGVDLGAPEFGMMRVPRVATYRGFIFASLAAAGEPFALPALMQRCIDTIIERAPEEAVELAGGVHRYEFRGNWKAQVENILDHYHPAFSHESTMDAEGRQFGRREGEDQGTQIFDQAGGISGWDRAEIVAFPTGHGLQGPMPGADQPKSGAVFERYRAALLARHPPARVAEILANEWFHNAVFYPNMFIQLRALFVRVVRPIAVDHTEVLVYPIRLKGAPAEMFHRQIRFLNLTHSAGSLIQTDDMEMFRRVQAGLATSGADWVVLGRGLGAERPEAGGLRAPGTSELSMRAQYAAWTHYMAAE